MTARRLNADALLDLATEMLRAEVLPALGPEQRYAGAMIANALEIINDTLHVAVSFRPCLEALRIALHRIVLLTETSHQLLNLLVALLEQQILLVNKLLNLFAAITVAVLDILNFSFVPQREVFQQSDFGFDPINQLMYFGHF